MVHAAPPGPRRPLLALVAGFALLALLGGTAWVAASRGGGEPVAVSQASPVVRGTPASPEALKPAQACERAVLRVLVRYGSDLASGAVSVTVVTPAESEALDAVPPARDAYLVVMDELTTLVGPWGRHLPVSEAVARVTPKVRRVCQQAG
ncbi:hypothetical protein [Actinomadura geliboluensis]|uniref:hypothetical protein n=1 Tax=Actinomadura geliboluensis TaxID=882440 RepID=UPI0036762115